MPENVCVGTPNFAPNGAPSSIEHIPHMSQSKRIRVKILNPLPGQRPHVSLERARRLVRKGLAVWHDVTCTVLRMVEVVARAALAAPVTVGMIQDSGFDGFLRYPPPLQTSGCKFPALARAGAGL